MSDRVFGVLDGALVGLVVLGLAIWQLISVNREIAKDRNAKTDVESASPDSASPKGSGHPVGEHRLDDR